MNETKEKADLTSIAEYIKDLKLRSVMVGGVDKEEALLAIMNIHQMFTETYADVEMELEASRQRTLADQAHRDGLVKENDMLRKAANENKKKLDDFLAKSEQLSAQVKAEAAEKAKHEAEQKWRQQLQTAEDDLRTKLKEANKLREKAEKQLEAKEVEHEREMKIAHAGAEAKGELLEDIYLEARETRKRVIEEANRQSADILKAMNDEVEGTRRELESELAEARQAVEQELSESRALSGQLRAEAEAEADTLRRQLEMENARKQSEIEAAFNNAKEEAELLRRNAEEEVEMLWRKAEEEARKIMEKANSDADALRLRYRLEDEESRRKSDEEIAEANAKAELILRDASLARETAEHELENARQESAYIVDSAKIPFQREQKKYNSQLRRLSLLRSQTLLGLQDMVNKMNKLVFDMSSEGLRTDAENNFSFTELESPPAFDVPGDYD